MDIGFNKWLIGLQDKCILDGICGNWTGITATQLGDLRMGGIRYLHTPSIFARMRLRCHSLEIDNISENRGGGRTEVYTTLIFLLECDCVATVWKLIISQRGRTEVYTTLIFLLRMRLRGTSLEIDNISEEDTGQYICEVETFGTPINQIHTLQALGTE